MLWFSLPIFEHIERHRRAGPAAVGPAQPRVVHQHLQAAIAELIGDPVRTALQRAGRSESQVSPELLVRWIASTLVLVLNWWVESDSPLSGRDADRLFRGLIQPALAKGL